MAPVSRSAIGATVACLTALVAAPATGDVENPGCAGASDYRNCKVIAPPGQVAPAPTEPPNSGGEDGGDSDAECIGTLGKPIDCTSGEYVWRADHMCYLDPEPLSTDPTDGLPAWNGQTDGAIHMCFSDTFGGGSANWPVWVAPAEEAGPSPAELAQQAVDSMELRAVEIGMAPEPDNADPNILIRMPNQVYATNAGPNALGPTSASASAGGITVTAEGRPTGIDIDPGDGSAPFSCTTTELAATQRALEGPGICSVTWEHTSTEQPDGTYPLTVTTHWEVTWEGGGESGVITFDLTNTRPVAVRDRKVNLVP